MTTKERKREFMILTDTNERNVFNYSFMLYFFLNLSILPAVSTNFCLPVKNGWQDEQISTLMSFVVERVSITFPQAQVIFVISYLG